MFKNHTDGPQKEVSDAIVRMAYVAELKEWDNRDHLERIRRYCLILGSGLGLQQQEIETISLASQLHDVGKITIPEILLKRKGEYEEDEWVIIERHTIEGAIILNGSASPVLKTAELIAYTHHERWDGSGYPQGLKGEDIPMSGRICALADVFDGLTTKRTYKDPIGEGEAHKLIRSASGSLFDPQLVEIFNHKFNEILRVKNAVRLS